MIDRTAHDALKIFAEQACTLSLSGERVSIQCDTREDAELVFDFLEQLVEGLVK